MSGGSSAIRYSGIQIKEVRVRNYRCLREVDVQLDALTLLIGQNNSGKTSFLNALFAAIGAGPRSITSEDIFLKKGEASAPRDRTLAIDILILPTECDGSRAPVFPEGSPWLELWGSGVVQDENDNDLVAIRTFLKWNAPKGEYVVERRFLKEWQPDGAHWTKSTPLEHHGPVQTHHTEPLALYFLDARRDISDDLRNRSSFWSKMVAEHGLLPEDVEAIEGELTKINERIVNNSQVFSHIQDHLRGFHRTLSCDEDSITITPLTRNLRDLSKGMDVVLSTRDAPPFPLRQQGMGTRSLGTMLTLWAFMTWRQQQSSSESIHPMTALEEPETHLHPHAQRAVFDQIKSMPGQRLVTSHSPYVCSQAEISSIRHFAKEGDETVVRQIEDVNGSPALTAEDVRKINRQVMNTRGDMLFARFLVLFEGETEEQALPDFAGQHFGCHPNDLGCSFIGVGGHNGYLPFLRLAESFKIPWAIFSDGENEAKSAIDRALAAIGENPMPHPNVLVLPKGMNFESYIADVCDQKELANIVIQQQAMSPKHQEVLEREWNARSKAAAKNEAAAAFGKYKTQYGAKIGKALTPPPMVTKLFSRIEKSLGSAEPQELFE